MSIIKYGRPLADFVQTDNGLLYYVDSCFTPDCGYETMVFLAEENGPSQYDAEVVDWDDRYVEHYSSFREMEKRHFYICKHLEELLGKEEKQ